MDSPQRFFRTVNLFFPHNKEMDVGGTDRVCGLILYKKMCEHGEEDVNNLVERTVINGYVKPTIFKGGSVYVDDSRSRGVIKKNPASPFISFLCQKLQYS